MITSLVAFVVVLGVLIFVHEAGHFVVARLFKVGIRAFSLGFGLRLFGKTVGRTDYRVCAIPLGGYVKMVGENPARQVAPEDRPVSFSHKNVYQRMAIVAAGPLANVLLAVVCLSVLFAVVGVQDRRPVIRHVEKGGPAQKAGLLPNDRIVAIDGRSTESWYDVKKAIEDSRGDVVTLTAGRGGRFKNLPVTPTLRVDRDVIGDEIRYFDADMSPQAPTRPVIRAVTPGSPAERAGLQKGDRVAGINGAPVDNWSQLRKATAAAAGKPLDLTIRRGAGTLRVQVAPVLTVTRNSLGMKTRRYLLGVTAETPAPPREPQLRKKLPPGEAVIKSLGQTWFIIDVTLRGLVKIVSGSLSLDNIGGPVLIAQVVDRQVKEGLDRLVQLVAFISINLAIINLLPIPVLDGGHLVFFTIEALRGRPVSLRAREIAHQAGMFILLMLALFVFYIDLARIFLR